LSWIHEPSAWSALVTLTVLELVLGIDNIVMLTVVTGRLPAARRAPAQRIGLVLAMALRIVLLLGLTWVLGLTAPLFVALGHEISGRDLIMIGGGLFLIAKGVHEIHHKLEGVADGQVPAARATMAAVLAQILLLDLVFSLDSVITAIGMAEHTQVMVLAIVISVALMMVIAAPISAFVDRHPDGEDAGAELPAADRRGARRRRPGEPHPAGLHLLRARVLHPGGGAQPADGPAARRVRRSLSAHPRSPRVPPPPRAAARAGGAGSSRGPGAARRRRRGRPR
jgi:predicted tellurium resistance membrane protein TerC